MISDEQAQLYSIGLIDGTALFEALFSAAALVEVFEAEFATSTGKGVDRLNGFQFAKRATVSLATAATRCIAGHHRFAPYLETLKTKGRDKLPRLVAIPIVRDRVVLHQLNRFLGAVYPDCVPKNVAGTYVRTISADLKNKPPGETWVCGTDIKTFYDAIQQGRLLQVLRQSIDCKSAVKLVARALATPTVPKNTRRRRHSEFRSKTGVPQGLAISNILASIYMKEVDEAMRQLDVTYYRYVDDVLIYGPEAAVQKAFRSLSARLTPRGLSLHGMSSGKTQIAP